jgi:integrase/recombinase XerC
MLGLFERFVGLGHVFRRIPVHGVDGLYHAFRRPGVRTRRGAAGPRVGRYVTPALLDDVLSGPAIIAGTRGTPCSPATLHRLKASVRSFFAWAEETGMIASNPARFVRLQRLNPKPPAFLTEREKRQLLKTLRQTDAREARRDRVIIEMFLGTGIRLQELVNLDVDDVDLDAKHIRIVGKGNVPQVKFLKTDLRSLLRGYLSVRRCAECDSVDCLQRRTSHAALRTEKCSALFLSNRDTRLTARQVARRLDTWVEAASIGKHLGPHALRHTFATHLYAKSGDILIV